MANRIKAIKARMAARVAARKALANGAEPSQAALVAGRVARRFVGSSYYTPMFFKSQGVSMGSGSMSDDPTVMYHPLARAELNQRDPTMVELEVRETPAEGEPAGVGGFFDTLPSWVLPVAIGVIAILAIVMATRISANPKPVSQD